MSKSVVFRSKQTATNDLKSLSWGMNDFYLSSWTNMFWLFLLSFYSQSHRRAYPRFWKAKVNFLLVSAVNENEQFQ